MEIAKPPPVKAKLPLFALVRETEVRVIANSRALVSPARLSIGTDISFPEYLVVSTPPKRISPVSASEQEHKQVYPRAVRRGEGYTKIIQPQTIGSRLYEFLIYHEVHQISVRCLI